MEKRILVPMDDSEHAERALDYALENFPDADVTVLHVVGAPSMMMGDATSLALADDFEAAVAERAEGVFERARQAATDRDRGITTVAGVGHPAKNVIERAEDYDTVVIGAHGADRGRATRRFLVGNVAETISKRAPVPVVLVR